MTGGGRRGLLVATDVAGYGSLGDPQTVRIQQRLVDVLREVYARAGIDAPTERIVRALGGDSTVDLIHDVPEAATVSRLVTGFEDVLRADNADHAEHARLRIRVAIGQGVADRAAAGLSGRDVVTVCRICDCPAARAALDDHPGADLVVLLSAAVHLTSVVDGTFSLRPERFEEVPVPRKARDVDGDTTAWLTVPGGARAAGPGPGPGRRAVRVEDGGLVLPDGPLPPGGPFGRLPGQGADPSATR